MRAAERLLDETGVDPGDDRRRHVLRLDVARLRRSGRRRRTSPTGSAATNAFAIEYDNVSHGTPIALRVARDLLRAEEELQNVLVVAACRESYLLDYTNERSRFMFNFGDGAVAGLLVGDAERNEVLGAHAITDGSYSLQVKVPRRRLGRSGRLPLPRRRRPASR